MDPLHVFWQDTAHTWRTTYMFFWALLTAGHEEDIYCIHFVQNSYSFMPNCPIASNTSLVFIVILQCSVVADTTTRTQCSGLRVSGCVWAWEALCRSAGFSSIRPSRPAPTESPFNRWHHGFALQEWPSLFSENPALHPVRAQPPAAHLNYCRRSCSPREARARARVRWGVTQLSLEQLPRWWWWRGRGELQSGARLCSRWAEVLRLELR